MKKYLLLSGVVSLSLVGAMLVAYRDNRGGEVAVRYDNNYSDPHYNDGRRSRRGPVRATVEGASDVVRGTGHAIGHGLKDIFGGGNNHRGYYDSRGNYRK